MTADHVHRVRQIGQSPALTRATIISRSTSPNTASIPNMARPAGVVVFTHECLAVDVARKVRAVDVIYVLSDLFILRGVPRHIPAPRAVP